CSHDPRGSTIISEIFARGTEPTEFCDTHVSLRIDSITNKIATEFCPSSAIVSRVFIKRNPPYNPGKHNGIVPSDYQYTAPYEQCTGGHIRIKDDDKDKDKDKDKKDKKKKKKKKDDEELPPDDGDGNNGGEDPTKPDKPEKPEKPDESNKPEKPENPENPDKPKP